MTIHPMDEHVLKGEMCKRCKWPLQSGHHLVWCDGLTDKDYEELLEHPVGTASALMTPEDWSRVLDDERRRMKKLRILSYFVGFVVGVAVVFIRLVAWASTL